jgi:serine protease
MRRLLVGGIVIVLAACPAQASVTSKGHAGFKTEKISGGITTTGTSLPPVEVVAEQVLVRFDPAATAAQRASVLAAISGTQIGVVVGWTVIGLPSGASVVSPLALVKAMPGVLESAPNHVLYPTAVPSDPAVPQQYALQQVNAFAAWEYEKGFSNPTTIVVIDAGIKGTQPDLAAKIFSNVAKSQAFNPTTGASLGADDPPTPACNHATYVASVAAASASNGIGIAGMSWGAKLLSLKIFSLASCGGDPAGDCNCGTNDVAIAAAIDYVRTTVVPDPQAGRVVINLSIGGAGTCAASTPATKTALENLEVGNGVPVAIASGNAPFCSGGASSVDSPANCAGNLAGGKLGVIPVTATDATNNITSYSCTGSEVAAHGLSAPGDKITVDQVNGSGTTTDSGTSFSAPHVAGLMALMLSAKPTMTAAQVESALRGGADSIGGQSLGTGNLSAAGNASGAGRMDAFRTMRLTINGTLADFQGDQKAIAFPNPFRLSQTGSVSLTIPLSVQGSNPTIRVYTADGLLVRTLNGLTWDGKNDSGNLVASGTYIFLVKTGAGSTTGRVSVIR